MGQPEDMENPSTYVCKDCGQTVVEETQDGPLKLVCPACGGTDWMNRDSKRYEQWLKNEACVLTKIPHRGLYVPYTFASPDGNYLEGKLAVWLVNPDFFIGEAEVLSKEKLDEIILQVAQRPLAFYDHGWKRWNGDEVVKWDPVEDIPPSYVAPQGILTTAWVQFWSNMNKASFLNSEFVVKDIRELPSLIRDWERLMVALRIKTIREFQLFFKIDKDEETDAKE